MAKIWTLFISIISCFSTLVSAGPFDDDCDCFNDIYDDIDNATARFISTNTAVTGSYLYQHLVKYKQQSYSVVTLPLLAVVGHLVQFADCNDCKRLLKFLNMKNKQEIEEVVSKAVDKIKYHSDTESRLSFKVNADECERFTYKFKQVFKDVCDGESGYLDYMCPDKALEDIYDWFTAQSPYPVQPLDSSKIILNDNQSVIYLTSMDYVTNFDHEANPNALIDIDFYVSENKSIKFPSLYGIGYFRYVELENLDAKFLQIILKGGRSFGSFLYPNKADNLEELMRRVQDPKVFNDIIDSAQWMCLKIHITVGHAFVTNELMEFIPELQLNTTHFQNVTRSGNSVHVNNILQELHLIGDKIVREGQINSKLCPEEGLPFVVINHACAYYVIDSDKMIIYAGVLFGPQNYGT